MKLATTLGLGLYLAASQGTGAGVAQTTGAAPSCCGAAPVHDPSQKSMVGTAVNSENSSVYFTGFRGDVSEIDHPTVDTLATSNMEFLVGDTAKTFLDEEKYQGWTATLSDTEAHAMAGGDRQRRPRLANHQDHFCRSFEQHVDPANDLRGSQRQDGRAFQPLSSLQALFEERRGEQQRDDGGLGGQTYLTAGSGDGSEFSALGASLAWTVQNGVATASNGYAGVNDGWQDLDANNPSPYTTRWAYGSAPNGNVAQMGLLDTAGKSSSSITFTVAVGFGATEAAAIAAASTTLGEDVSAQQSLYDNASARLRRRPHTQNGTADDQYTLSAMTLKSMQDKTNGAMIAGIGTPWGFAGGDGDLGYHLVWPRDMYKFANALINAGDSASATSAVNWLFNVDMNPTTGRFPQNSYVNGTPNWNATQMDEQAMPIILAYRLGPSVTNALWPKIRMTANYILSNGPWTQESAGRKPAAIRPRPSPPRSPGWSTPPRSPSRTTTPPMRRAG